MPDATAALLVAVPGRDADPQRTAELVAAARSAAPSSRARIVAATGGDAAGGADELHTLGGAALDVPDVRAWASALLDVCRAVQPSLVLLGDDPFDRAVAAWMAQRSGGGVVTGGVELHWDGAAATVVRGVLGGAGVQTCRVAGGTTPFVCLARGATVHGGDAAAASHNGATHAAPASRHHTVDAPLSAQLVAERTAPQRLRGARIVVSGGAGAGGAEGFAKLRRVAELLGAATGAARGAIVNGWAEGAEKVGLTGATVTPDLYLAVGISGASQHMAGCRRSRVIVAVNRDRGAPIFRHATYGLVADSTAVLDALLAQLQAAAAVQDRTPEDAAT